MPIKNAADFPIIPIASVEFFGLTSDGQAVHKIHLQSRVVGGDTFGVAVLTAGAAVQELKVPDRAGNVADVVLALPDLEGYFGPTNFCYGGTPGRFANRISNGSFHLEGKQHNLTANWKGSSGKMHTLHGGESGFHKQNWDISKGPWVDEAGAHVTLALQSPAGDEGFPGNLKATLTYSWQADADGQRLQIRWEAITDATTVVNLTNHTYFNLMGVEAASNVLDTHIVTLNCDFWTEVDGDGIPTGQLLSVEGTPMDFRTPRRVGDRIQDAQGGGYDHNYVVTGGSGAKDEERFVGRVDCDSGRRLECWATQPGVQFFTMQPGTVFDKTTVGKYGVIYPVHGGLCLETQHFPDSPNQPSFPSTTLEPGQKYKESCSYRFSLH